MMRELLPRSVVVAVASCLLLACGGKTVGSELSGDDASSGASSSGGSSGSTSSGGGSSSGGSSSGTTSSSGTGSSSSSSGATVSCVYVDLSTYDQSCQQPSDCIDVVGGEVCSGDCDCPDDLVNSSQRSRYDQAISAIEFGLCSCPAVPSPQCVDQLCTRVGLLVDAGPPDEGPPDEGPPDARVCVDVDLSTYDTSCQLDSDCIEITAGALCTGQCDCGGSTINIDGEARYEAAVAPVRFEACPCAVGAPLRCIQNQCTRCAFGLNDPPGCNDDGG